MHIRRIAALALSFFIINAATHHSPAQQQPPNGNASASSVPRWIWGSKDVSDDQAFVFRRTFDATDVATRQTPDGPQKAEGLKAVVWATCDNEAVIHINGQVAAYSSTWERPMVKDVTNLIQPGKNVIAIRGRNNDSMAGMICRLLITSRGGKRLSIVSDGTWLSMPIVIDDKADKAWARVDFDDSQWKNALVIGEHGIQPWGTLPGADGRPVQATPAEKLTLLPGFKAELLFSVPKETHDSWVSMTPDPKGRLIVSGQDGPMFRVTPGKSPEDTKVEEIPLQLGYAQGLLWAYDSLYVTVNGKGVAGNTSGLYRVRDTNNDDTLDDVKQLIAFKGRDGKSPAGGEHGPHGLRVGPDGKIYLVAGNFTNFPERLAATSPFRNYAEDILLPRNPDGGGHDPHIMAPGGWVARTDPDGKTWEVVAAGLRNTYDIDFNTDGELFNYDSDMEWDTGTPWYRPIRVNLIASGGEYGWRNGTGKWPDYYPDSLGAVVNTGMGSPTGVAFGTGAKFPAKYQRAFYIQDWSYGHVYAVHLTPDGAGYRASFEDFVSGKPFGVTDLCINHDGAMYITIGGRGTQSGLYRITYVGNEDTSPISKLKPVADREWKPEVDPNDPNAQARATRHKLESFHGKQNSEAVSFAWPYLNSRDRYLRYAARVAIEFQPVDSWIDLALNEKRPTAAINALIALTRVTARSPEQPTPQPYEVSPESKQTQKKILAALNTLPLRTLSEEQFLEACRAYGLLFTRTGPPDAATASELAHRLDAFYPAQSTPVNREVSQLLTYLQSPTVITKSMDLLSKARSQEDQLHYVFTLRNMKSGWTLDQRKAYFSWLAHAERNLTGGASFKRFLLRIRDDAMKTLSDEERPVIEAFLKEGQPIQVVQQLKPRQFVRNWQMQDLLPVIDQATSGRDFARGKEALESAQCLTCHRFVNDGGATGPDLTGAGNRFNATDLLEAILLPNKVISDQYENTEISTTDKDFFVGRIEAEDAEKLTLRTHPLSPETVTILKKNITKRGPSKISMMPEGLIDNLKQEEILDLLAYLRSAANPNDPAFKK